MPNIFLFALLAFFALVSPANAQETCQGQIFDSSTGEALAGVVVAFNDSTVATVSNDEGLFTVAFPQDSILLFSRVGYHSFRLPLNSKSTFLNVALKADPFALKDVLVTAFYSQKPQDELSFSLSLLESEDLQQDQEVNIAPALNRLPGVQVQQGAFNTNRLVIRGVGARSLYSTSKIRVYLNDIPLTDGEGQTVLDDIDPSLIERVEVMRGTGSSVYGAALGGTILLKTRQPESQKLELGQRNTLGSYGLWRNLTRLEYAKDNLRLSLAYSRLGSEGYRENSRYQRGSLTALAELRVKSGQALSLFYHYTDTKAFIPSSISDSIFRVNPRAAAANWAEAEGYEDYQSHLIASSLKQNFSPNWQWRSTLFVGLRRAEEPRPFDVLREQQVRLGTRQVLTYRFKIDKYDNKILLGTEYFQEQYNGQRFEPVTSGIGALQLNQAQIRRYSSTFLQANIQPSFSTIINAGLSLNYQQYQLEILQSPYQQSELLFTPLLAPYLGLHHKLSFTWLYAQASRGFAPPALSETLDDNGALNRDLKQENGWNFELGAKGNALKGKLHYQAAAYYMPIRDLLVARRTAEDTFVGINAGKTRQFGVELALDYNILQAQKYFIQLSTNYTWANYRFQDFVDDTQNYSHNQLTGVPEHQFNINLQANYAGFGFNINSDYVGTMPITDDNQLYSQAYMLINAQVYWQKTTNRGSFKLFFNLNNVSDIRYAAMLLVNAPSFGNRPPRYYYPGFAQNYLLGLQFSRALLKF